VDALKSVAVVEMQHFIGRGHYSNKENNGVPTVIGAIVREGEWALSERQSVFNLEKTSTLLNWWSVILRIYPVQQCRFYMESYPRTTVAQITHSMK
jgi:hypothetical protein